MTFMVKWAYKNPFGKIGGDESGPVTRQRAQDIDFGESEITMTDTEVGDVQSPSSTITQYQFQKLAPLQNDSPRQALQSDIIMMDAPSVYDQQLCYTPLVSCGCTLTPGALSTSTYQSVPRWGHVRYPAEES